jgi:hypothetical protein
MLHQHSQTVKYTFPQAQGGSPGEPKVIGIFTTDRINISTRSARGHNLYVSPSTLNKRTNPESVPTIIREPSLLIAHALSASSAVNVASR